MLILFTTFLLVLAGISLAVLVKKLVTPVLIEEGEKAHRLAAESYRPLFAPTDEELQLAEAEESKQLTAKQAEDERLLKEEQLAELEKFRQTWLGSPGKAATIELLYRASQIANGEVYLNICEDVLAAWREGRLADIAAADLAQLLETHFWLLPAEKRTPGISFRLKEAAAELTSKTDENM